MHTETILKRFDLDESDIESINCGELDWQISDHNELILIHQEHGHRIIGVLTEEEIQEALKANEFDQRISVKKKPNNSKLFVDGTIDNWAGVALNTNWKSLTESYSKSAYILGDKLEKSEMEPYLFLCRHTLELELKAITMLGQRFLNLSEDLSATHDLNNLWTSAYPMILGLKINLAISEVSRIKGVVDAFHESDSGSYAFRYPVNKKNAQIFHGKNLTAFDINYFREQFQKVEHSLSEVINNIRNRIAWKKIWKGLSAVSCDT